MSRLRERYDKEVVPALKKEFGYYERHGRSEDPEGRREHGSWRGDPNAKIIEVGADELARITGQKPVVRRAKKSIAAFKVRKGQPIATSVTLRGDRDASSSTVS